MEGGGGLQNRRGEQVKFVLPQKIRGGGGGRGSEKVLDLLKRRHKKFRGSFNVGHFKF